MPMLPARNSEDRAVEQESIKSQPFGSIARGTLHSCCLPLADVESKKRGHFSFLLRSIALPTCLFLFFVLRIGHDPRASFPSPSCTLPICYSTPRDGVNTGGGPAGGRCADRRLAHGDQGVLGPTPCGRQGSHLPPSDNGTFFSFCPISMVHTTLCLYVSFR